MCIEASAISSIFSISTIAPAGYGPERSVNQEIGRNKAASRIDRAFFCRSTDKTPLLSQSEFERSYRIPRQVYEEIRPQIIQKGPLFQQTCDESHKVGASTDINLKTALRMLTKGGSSFSSMDLTCLSESLALESAKWFGKDVVYFFGGEWLRRPNSDGITLIEGICQKLGFPGFIGCFDCAGWSWNACTDEWKGKIRGKDHKPTCSMEVVCDEKLCV